VIDTKVSTGERMSAREQLLFSGDLTPRKGADSFQESGDMMLAATPTRTSITDDTQDDEHMMSPTVTTVKRPRIAPCSSSASLLHQTFVEATGSRSEGLLDSSAARDPHRGMSDPSPAPKKPRVDQFLKNVLGAGGAPRPEAPLPSQKDLLPAVTPQTAVRTTQQQQLSQQSPPLSLTAGSLFSDMAPFATPVATQLFEPDEPLTATQDAFVVDGFEMPSPPPFFGPAGDSQERRADGSTPIGGSAGRRRVASDTKSTQESLVQWAESTKAFFNFIDRRNLIDVDE
jgi:hypothetical protein